MRAANIIVVLFLASQAVVGQAQQAPATADTYLQNSFQLYSQGRFSEAIGSARAALRLKTDFAAAWNNIAASYNALGLFDDGLKAAQEAIRLQPDFELAKNNLDWAKVNLDTTPESYVTRSLVYFRLGKFEDSIAAARTAIALRPDYAEAWNNVAAASNALSRWAEGVQAAQQAVRLKPDFQLAKNNLAWAQSRLAAAKGMPEAAR